MRARSGGAALLAALAAVGVGCTTTRRVVPSSGSSRVTTAAQTNATEAVQDIVRRAIMLDAAADAAADSLYAPEALVVANARIRLGVPRFAGVGYGGRVTIAAATVTLEGRFAWILVDYRWVNPERNQAEAGRATFVCESRPNGWKIVHVHSSQLMPWDR
jgi:SnoaL-like protein